MLQRIKNQWKDLVACEVKALAAEKGFAIEPDIQVLTPPKPELGDVAFPMFAFAKAMRMAPPAIAAEVKSRLEKKSGVPSGELLVAGPYLNLKIDTSALTLDVAHINERRHGVTQEEAVSYIKNAAFSLKRRHWTGETFLNYYSEEGASYVRTSDNVIRTSFKKDEFDKKTKSAMEVLKNGE